MHIDPMTLARARLALREASSNYLYDPNVSLVDFGWPEHNGQIVEDELAIRIHVRQKLFGAALEAATDAEQTRPIPPSIGGFPTDVPQASFRLHSQWSSTRWGNSTEWLRATPINPIKGGISISNERDYTFGTLGGFVVDRTSGEPMILSNWHVLVGDWGARQGQRIYQPGRLDGGNSNNTVATLTRDAMSVNLDAAVATLTGDRSFMNEQFDLGTVKGVGQARLGMELVKSGRRTGITYGRVTGIEGQQAVSYGYLTRIIRHIVTIDQRQINEEVSAPGDSGAWWLDSQTMQAVGLHFAGSNAPEQALALDMPTVLNALNVDIATASARGLVNATRRV
jgi:hypothetical protein